MVAGDFLLDSYTIGKVRRISPEAPVAVLQVHHEEHRPGGAGNVILNLISMGAEVTTLGRIGADKAGEVLRESLEKEGVDLRGLAVQPSYPTPVKNRIIAENQQIVRVDHEQIIPLNEALEQQLIEALPVLLKDVKVVAISDYGKGFLTKTLLAALIDESRCLGITIISDPKGIEFSKYNGSHIIKPNLSEAYSAANLPIDTPLEIAAAKVLQMVNADVLMVTRSEAGISLFHKHGTREDFPVKAREVKDVTGAGDTVLAMLSCAMGNDLTISEAVQLANVAAGIAIERFGCARVSLSDLARRLLEQDVVNKIFDEEHLFALLEALKGRSFALLGLSGTKGLTTGIFSSIRRLAARDGWDLLVYIKDQHPSEEFINLLASLHDVDFILLKSESLKSLCEKMSPSEIYVMEDDVLKQLSYVEDLLLTSVSVGS